MQQLQTRMQAVHFVLVLGGHHKLDDGGGGEGHGLARGVRMSEARVAVLSTLFCRPQMPQMLPAGTAWTGSMSRPATRGQRMRHPMEGGGGGRVNSRGGGGARVDSGGGGGQDRAVLNPKPNNPPASSTPGGQVGTPDLEQQKRGAERIGPRF